MESLTAALIQAKCKTDNLKMITNLSIWGIGFQDVSILRQMPNLEVVSLPVNKISSLRDFQGLAKLRELSVRQNDIRHLKELLYLRECKKLENLWLVDNPCATSLNYRAAVAGLLPQLRMLDNKEVTPAEREASGRIDLAGIISQ